MKRVWGALLGLLAWCAAAQAAEPIKIGIVKTLAVGPIFVADARGYFTAEGLTPELVYIDSAEPISVAAASGAVDVGLTGLSAGFYNLAAQGALRIIAAGNREMPGFKNAGYLASNRAWAAGLTSLDKLAGRTVAVTQRGGMLDYDLALIVERLKLDPASVRVMAVQSNTNMASVVAGGQVDAGVFPVTPAMALLGKGDAKLLGWVGDVAPYDQANAAFVSTKTANDRHDFVERFLTAYRKGAHDYYAAFVGPGESRRDGPTAPDIIAILARYTGQPADRIDQAIPWVDADVRLDVADIKHQIAWFHAQGMLKGEVDEAVLLDARYVVPLPSR